jgi:hypothetical protein
MPVARARLAREIPPSRYKIFPLDGQSPRIGDLVALDQGFTGPDGLPMVIVYFPDAGKGCMYEAEVYESELE